MLSRLSAWWYGSSATSATSSLAAPSPAHPKQHPAVGTNSSAGIVSTLAEEFLNVAGSRSTALDANDELGRFEKSIIEEVAKLSAAQALWRQRKIDLLGAEEQINQPQVSLQPADSGSVYLKVLSKIKNELVEFFTSPQAEIRNLLDNSRPHLDEQQEHINKLVASLHQSTDVEEQKRIKVQICDINIDLLGEFISMINDVKAKIESSLAVDIVGEKVALSFLQTTLLVMAQVAFPSLDAQVEQGIRDYLGRAIREQGDELDKELTRLEGEIAQAWRHVDLNKVDAASAADAAPAPVEMQPVEDNAVQIDQSGINPSTVGLFAAAASNVSEALRASAELAPSTPALN